MHLLLFLHGLAFSADAKSWSNTALRFYTTAGHRYAERTRDSSPFQDPDLDGDGRLCGLDEFEQLAANHFGRSQESSHYDGVTIIACTGEANEPPQDECLNSGEQLTFLSCLQSEVRQQQQERRGE